MRFSSLFSHLGELIFPSRCIICREPVGRDTAFCHACEAEYRREILSECGICGRVLSECACSNAFLSKHGVRRMVKLFRYRPSETHEHSFNLLLYRLKHQNVRAPRDFLAARLAEALKASVGAPVPAVITYVPRTVRERRKYGFDQSEQLAKALSVQTGLPFAPLLFRRKKASPQKNMRSAEERMKNAEGSYMPRTEEGLNGKTVFLLDDTVTTGASVAACARILRKMGAKEIIAVAPFISFRPKNLHFEHMKNTREERYYAKK